MSAADAGTAVDTGTAVETGIAVDTSIVVAGLVADHTRHEAARAVLAAGPAIPAHVAFESYSVLTRLPSPGRLSPAVVSTLLERAFAGRYVALSASEQATLLADLPGKGIAGGAVYDALVAATARRHGLTLRSLDQRAAPTYKALGVAYELI